MAKAVASLLSDLAALNATSLLSMTANEDGCWPTPGLGASLHFAKDRNKKTQVNCQATLVARF